MVIPQVSGHDARRMSFDELLSQFEPLIGYQVRQFAPSIQQYDSGDLAQLSRLKLQRLHEYACRNEVNRLDSLFYIALSRMLTNLERVAHNRRAGHTGKDYQRYVAELPKSIETAEDVEYLFLIEAVAHELRESPAAQEMFILWVGPPETVPTCRQRLQLTIREVTRALRVGPHTAIAIIAQIRAAVLKVLAREPDATLLTGEPSTSPNRHSRRKRKKSGRSRPTARRGAGTDFSGASPRLPDETRPSRTRYCRTRDHEACPQSAGS